MTGDASTLDMELFTHIYNSIDGALSVEDMGDRAAARLQQSIETNPIFYYGPYTGFLVRNAGLAFAIRLLSNHTEEYPRGGHLGGFRLLPWNVKASDMPLTDNLYSIR